MQLSFHSFWFQLQHITVLLHSKPPERNTISQVSNIASCHIVLHNNKFRHCNTHSLVTGYMIHKFACWQPDPAFYYKSLPSQLFVYRRISGAVHIVSTTLPYGWQVQVLPCEWVHTTCNIRHRQYIVWQQIGVLLLSSSFIDHVSMVSTFCT